MGVGSLDALAVSLAGIVSKKNLCYGMRQPFSSVYSDSCSYDQSSCALVAIATGSRRTRPLFILELLLCRLRLSVISLGRIRDPGTAQWQLEHRKTILFD